MSLSLLPIGLRLEEVRVIPKEELESKVKPFIIDEIEVGLKFWSLIRGRVALDSLLVDGVTLDLTLDEKKKSKKKTSKLDFEKITESIPFRQVEFKNTQVRIDLPKKDSYYEGNDLDFLIRKQSNSIHLAVNSGTLDVLTPALERPLNLSLETKVFILNNQATISSFKASHKDSYVIASGILDFDLDSMQLPSYDLKTRLNLNMDEISSFVLAFKDLQSFPESTGLVKADIGALKKKKSKLLAMDFRVRTESLFIEGHEVGNAFIEGKGNQKDISINQVEIKSSAGKLSLWQTSINIDGENAALKTNVTVPNLEVRRFLESILVKNVPINMPLRGEFPCEGTLSPEIEINCTGKILVQSLSVTNKGRTTRIVDFSEGELDGKVRITDELVEYDTAIRIKNSEGSSKGVIKYDEGFNISYAASKLDFADVENLAELKIEGITKLEGVTEGNSDWATLSMNLDGKDVFLEDFKLANIKTNLSYKKGNLFFKKIRGNSKNSRYRGDITVDVENNTIKGSAKIPYMEANDVLDIFARKTKLPFEVTGSGAANVRLSGPLRFNALTYEFRSSLFRGKIGPEPFDEFVFDVSSKNGNVSTKRVHISRGRSKIYMRGKGKPNGDIDVRVTGKGLFIEDSNLISKTGLNTVGLLDIDMRLNGYVLSPDTTIAAKFNNMTLGGEPVEDSSMKLQVRSNSVEGSAQFLGGTLKTEFLLPYNTTDPFRFKVSAKDWNFAKLIASFDEDLMKRNFTSSLTGTLDLYSASGGFWAASGGIEAEKVLVQRGNLKMSNPKPIRVSMTEGKFQFNELFIEGENTFFKINNSPNPVQPLDIQINSKVNMGMLSLFTPFLEDIRGLLSASFTVKANKDKLEVLGSAYVEQGYFKIFNFIHPLADVRADLLFSQKQILVNSLKGSFASGRFFGDGKILFENIQSYPTDINVQFEDVNLKFPSNFDTYGSGNIYVKGNWFPFTLGGNYIVDRGTIAGNLISGKKEDDETKRYFLPKLLLEDQFNPLQLNLAVKTQNPVTLQKVTPSVIAEIDGQANANIRIQGLLNKPVIKGPISIVSNSILKFQENEFNISTANVEMRGSEDYNPNLYVEAITRKNGYEINLLVQGEALNPEITLSSTPNLPEQDIFSLLALGITSQDFNENVSSSEQFTQSIFQGGAAYLLGNPVGQEIKERFGWDAQLTPTFDDENNSSVPKIIFSKKLSEKADISASREIGKAPKTDVRLKYQFNPKLSTILSYESTDFSDTSSETNTIDEQNIYGLDFEYRLEFK